ncbi:MAG TPA: Stp1/IreP family PP2C-type Ser/Thr phosphatase [Anaeromyxobacteraceae bacterium]|nr:Stp1/IreP family PP2C-type Ser/Thr phosphatase [Anaeromyxobacteraceae bacterium]
MRLSIAGGSHAGLLRHRNEDAFLLLPEERLLCVADGMGGHASGEVAARIAVEEMADFFRLTARDVAAGTCQEERLLTGVRRANQRIRERAALELPLRGMGTTLVCALFPEGEPAALIGHVGDSRAYLFRQGMLRRLTEDHSLVNELVKARQIAPHEAEEHPYRNVISRALGMRDQVDVDVSRVPLETGDAVLLCCDGLTGMLPDQMLARILRATRGDLSRSVDALIQAANEAGGVDNVTCVVAQVDD